MLELRNPHSILAAIRVRPRAVKLVRVGAYNAGDPWEEVVNAAREHGIPVQAGSDDRRQNRGGRGTERTGAGSADVEPPSPVPLEILWQAACLNNKSDDSSESDDSSRPGIWLALDQVQDPQNLGAIFRLAGFFGIQGIVLTKDRSAPVNATVCDVATGGAEYVPFSVVANLAQAMEKAQQNNIWILGTCERAESTIFDVDRQRSWMLVLGNEGQGMRRLTREKCDHLVSMPAQGPVPSLNVATAAAACLAILSAPP